MTCCHHYSVYTAFAKHIIVPFHPSTPSRFEVLSQPQLEHQLGTEKRIEGFGVFFGRCQESKNHSSSPLRTGFEKEMDMSFPIPGNFFFFLKTFFRDSNLLQLLQSFKSTRKSIRRRLEGAFNQLVFTARGIVRAVLMSGKVQEIYRTAVIQNSLKPVWKEARNFRIGLDLLISFVSCINVAYMMWC